LTDYKAPGFVYRSAHYALKLPHRPHQPLHKLSVLERSCITRWRYAVHQMGADRKFT